MARLRKTSTDERSKICFNRMDSIHRHGFAYILMKEIVNSGINCTPFYSRLIFRLVSETSKYHRHAAGKRGIT